MNIVFEKPTVRQFLTFCKNYPNVTVNGKPEGCGSWRGAYVEACIYCDFSSQTTLKEFIPFLQDLIAEDAVFWGYKGGEYHYSYRSELNFECQPSSYTSEGNFEKLFNNNWDEIDKDIFELFIKNFNFYGES